MSVDSMHDLGVPTNIGQFEDPTVTRYRPRFIISEQFDTQQYIATRRAAWEMARRIGRSQSIRLTTDTWRDSAGRLWEPNTLALVDVPACKVVNQTWCISSVTYRRDGSGTHADLMLMPPAAFTPQPDALQLFDWQVARDPGNSAGNTPTTGAS